MSVRMWMLSIIIACGADAEGVLNRADFGMTQYSQGELGKSHLRIQVEARKDD